jgi:hypothetical protein
VAATKEEDDAAAKTTSPRRRPNDDVDEPAQHGSAPPSPASTHHDGELPYRDPLGRPPPLPTSLDLPCC